MDDLTEVVAKYHAADLPLEAMWTDIDYMDGYRDFSLDPDNFPKAKMQVRLHGCTKLASAFWHYSKCKSRTDLFQGTAVSLAATALDHDLSTMYA